MAYLTTSKVAEHLSVSVDKVLAWIHSGELPAKNLATTTKTRPRWRVSEQSLEKFLDSRSSAPPAPEPERRPQKPKSHRTYY